MARGTITEEELAAGIKPVGVLSAVAATHGQRREHPFGPPQPPKSQRPERQQVEVPPEVKLDKPPAPPAMAEAATAPNRTTDEAGAKAPSYDYITLPITANMRGAATSLAAELQRRRTDKALRFSANVLFRTAIEVILDDFELGPDDRVNSIDELKSLLRSKLNTNGARSRRS